ncbi:MAG: hypothetical protein QOI09_605 [Chloroflexota bacterium]|nr:hypothetical protein [Chloroflexota bacterium]
MRDASVVHSRTLWAALGWIVLGIVIALAVVAVWLPGPRAAVPTAVLPLPSEGAFASPPASRSPVGLPDPKLTPGSINPNVTSDNLATTICLVGWTATIRPPSAYTSALKLAQIVEYGYADRLPSHYQEDHLVPLELGGAPRDPRNLWPEPNDVVLPDGSGAGSAAKDSLEDELHRRVCAGTMPLGDGQRLIAGDWIAAWIDEGRP